MGSQATKRINIKIDYYFRPQAHPFSWSFQLKKYSIYNFYIAYGLKKKKFLFSNISYLLLFSFQISSVEYLRS